MDIVNIYFDKYKTETFAYKHKEYKDYTEMLKDFSKFLESKTKEASDKMKSNTLIKPNIWIFAKALGIDSQLISFLRIETALTEVKETNEVMLTIKIISMLDDMGFNWNDKTKLKEVIDDIEKAGNKQSLFKRLKFKFVSGSMSFLNRVNFVKKALKEEYVKVAKKNFGTCVSRYEFVDG